MSAIVPAPRFDAAGYHGTKTHGPDLYENEQNAIRCMIDWLGDTQSLTREQACVLCSAAADLRISQSGFAEKLGTAVIFRFVRR